MKELEVSIALFNVARFLMSTYSVRWKLIASLFAFVRTSSPTASWLTVTDIAHNIHASNYGGEWGYAILLSALLLPMSNCDF